jgi:hypothetical protein
MFMLGPKASGKTKVSQEMCRRSNMNHMDFTEFLTSKNLQDCDEEDVCMALLDCLANESYPRMIIENFP